MSCALEALAGPSFFRSPGQGGQPRVGQASKDEEDPGFDSLEDLPGHVCIAMTEPTFGSSPETFHTCLFPPNPPERSTGEVR